MVVQNFRRMDQDNSYRNVEQKETRARLEKEPFDPEKWLNWFNYHKNSQSINGCRAMRKLIMYQTMAWCGKLKYPLRKGEFVKICDSMESVRKQAHDTKFFDFSKVYEHTCDSGSPGHELECHAIQIDCLDAAIRMKLHLGLNPLVLNMASPKRPGGGYLSGAGAQEENIFRRSNYFQILEDQKEFANKRSWSYPIPEFSAIYSPSVFVFRDTEANGYALMHEPVDLSFVAVAAYRRPPLTEENREKRLTGSFIDGTKRKIEIMLQMARVHGHDSLVLSAFGCGAFKNPAKHMAELFKEVIEKPEWKGFFKKIVFAIIEDKNSVSAANPQGNFLPFSQTFGETNLPGKIQSVSILKRSNQEESVAPKKPVKFSPKEAYETATSVFFDSPSDKNGFLSSDFKCQLSIEGNSFWSVSHYLVFCKFNGNEQLQKQVLKIRNMQNLIILEFENNSQDQQPEPDCLRKATQEKYLQNEGFLEMLKRTGSKQIVHLRDETENNLGKILMKIRDE